MYYLQSHCIIHEDTTAEEIRSYDDTRKDLELICCVTTAKLSELREFLLSRETDLTLKPGYLPIASFDSPSIFCISQNRTPVTMTLITLIMEQNGLGAGGWVLGFPRGVQCRSRSIQIEKKSKGEVVATYPSLVTTPRLDAIRPSYPGENIQIATLLQRERRLLPNPFDRIQ